MTYAIISLGGKQYQVKPGMVIDVERVNRPEGDEFVIDEVIFVHDDEGGYRVMDRSGPTGFQVRSIVLRHYRAPKVIVFKKRRKETYKKKQGHRQWLTALKITAIEPA